MGMSRARMVAAALVLASCVVIGAVVLATRLPVHDVQGTGQTARARPDWKGADRPAKTLLQGSDLTYLGSFKVPELPRRSAACQPTCASTSYMNGKGQVGGLGFNPAN